MDQLWGSLELVTKMSCICYSALENEQRPGDVSVRHLERSCAHFEPCQMAMGSPRAGARRSPSWLPPLHDLTSFAGLRVPLSDQAILSHNCVTSYRHGLSSCHNPHSNQNVSSHCGAIYGGSSCEPSCQRPGWHDTLC